VKYLFTDFSEFFFLNDRSFFFKSKKNDEQCNNLKTIGTTIRCWNNSYGYLYRGYKRKRRGFSNINDLYIGFYYCV